MSKTVILQFKNKYGYFLIKYKAAKHKYIAIGGEIMENYEMLSILNDEDLEVSAFAWTNKTKQETYCGSSCADSCCC